MAFVVTEACILCKHTDCVEVCPVECFHEGPNFLVIDPNECIDCALCKPECPVDAIYMSEDVPNHQRHFIELNAELSQNKNWIPLVEKKLPMPDHIHWETVKEKLVHLNRNDT